MDLLDEVGLLFAALGLASLAAAVLPRLLRGIPLSVPMVFVGAGALVFALLPGLPDPVPADQPTVALHLTEVCVIVSLMGAGLALNRPVGWRAWSSTWRLLGLVMPLSMLVVALLGGAVLGLGAAAAILLAAALAPTDPVLATEVQVSAPVAEPGRQDDEARFALTSEAGLNDGLAFPFVYLALAIAAAGTAPSGWLGHWLLVDVLYRLVVGVLGGLAVGWLLGRVFFSRHAERLHLTDHAQGFVAVAATFLAYGVTQAAHGYGFVAVFVCACAVRAAERHHEYHGVLHGFVEQVERLLTVVVLLLLGGALTRGALAGLTWPEVAVAVAFVLVIRPLTGWLGLTPGRTGVRERWTIAFFGVRGVGSLFYLAFAMQEGDVPGEDVVWRVAVLAVVVSVVVHGIAATPVMASLDGARRLAARRRRGRAAPETVPV